MEISEILPTNLIGMMFPGRTLIVESVGLAGIDLLAKAQGDAMFALAGNIYNRARINRWANCDFGLLDSRMNAHDPYLHEGLSKLLGEPAIKDIYWTKVSINDDALCDRTVAEILVSHVFLNDIQLGKILLQNPYKRSMTRGKEFKGLGLFGEVLRRMKEFGSERKCGQISLTALSADTVRFFQGFGFNVMKEFPRHLFPSDAGAPMEYNIGPRGICKTRTA